jgi:hypothetical protein
MIMPPVWQSPMTDVLSMKTRAPILSWVITFALLLYRFWKAFREFAIKQVACFKAAVCF